MKPALALCALFGACATAELPAGTPVDAEPVRDQRTLPTGDAGPADARAADRPLSPDAADAQPVDAVAADTAPPDGAALDAPPATPCTLDEAAAVHWTTGCSDNGGVLPCTPTVADDSQTFTEGQSALRWRCAGCGFDSWIAYAAPPSGWDLTGHSYLKLWLRTQLDEAPLGWQKDVYGHPPWIVLRDRGGRTMRVEPDVPDVLLDGSIGKWLLVSVPLGAAAGWQSTTEPGFTPADVTALEIHVDPWGGGFTLWLDGAAFGPGVFSGCR